MLGATFGAVEVLHPRPVRRHDAGPADFAARLTGARVEDVVRRGKFLWLVLDEQDGDPQTGALLAHLGMSGQLVLPPAHAPDERHLRVRLPLVGGAASAAGRELRFVDQRMFGGLSITRLAPTPDGLPAGAAGLHGGPSSAWLPPPVAHIARDPLDPCFDDAGFIARLRGRRTGLKRALLDQGLISGIGNIYADEALWRARLHYTRATETVTRPAVARLLAAVREVMLEALAEGGTSFDSLYVDVNGESGYFDRALAVYGRGGRPCPRCGANVRREHFMNRSSYFCPRCQPCPRRVATR